MTFCTTLSTGLRLRGVPNSRKFSCNKGLGRDRLINNHSSRTNAIKDMLRESVVSERVNPPVMRKAADNNRVGYLNRELVHLHNRNAILTITKEDHSSRNLDVWLVKGIIPGNFRIETDNPRVVACLPLNRNDIVNVNSSLVEADHNVLTCNDSVDRKTQRTLLLYMGLRPSKFP